MHSFIQQHNHAKLRVLKNKKQWCARSTKLRTFGDFYPKGKPIAPKSANIFPLRILSTEIKNSISHSGVRNNAKNYSIAISLRWLGIAVHNANSYRYS